MKVSQQTSLPVFLLTVTCLLTDQPASVVGSERIALVDVNPVSRDRWSTRFSHARVPIAVFKNLQLLHVMHFKLSCFLDHLRVQRQSSASVSELLMTVSIVRERQQLWLVQSRPASTAAFVSCRSRPLILCASPCPAARVLCRKARSIVVTIEGDTFHKISLCRSTTGCDRVHQNSVCPRPPRCTHHSS